MNHLNPVKTGIALSKLLGTLHLIWAVLVGLGWAQALASFSMWAHMVSSPVVIKPFDLSAAVTIVIVASIVGYVVGYLFARFWNHSHRG